MATYLYVNDSGSNTWQLGVNDDGTLNTTSVTPSSPAPVLLDDSDTGVTTWQVIAALGTGNPESSPQTFDPSQPTEIMLQSSGGYFFILQVHSDGSLFTTPANVPGSLPGLPCGVPGKVTVTGPSEVLTIIGTDVSATGDPVLLAEALYQYANLDIPFSPNDPGLFYTYQNTDQLLHKTLAARFFNLLDEYSDPIFFDVGSAGPTPVVVSSTGNCLDPRLFGAVGDGVTDDTDAVQAALDKAHENYLQIQANLSASGGVAGIHYGPTIVCIPSDEVCLVTPRWDDQRDRSGAPDANSFVIVGGQPFYSSVLLAGTTRVSGQNGVGFPLWAGGYRGLINPYYPQQNLSCNFPGMAALLIDDGVTLLIDGGIKLGRSTTAQPVSLSGAPVTAEQFMYKNFYTMVYAIQNKNAFIQGPFSHSEGLPYNFRTQKSYQEWISGSVRTAPQDDSFSGNGTTTVFTLTQTPTAGSVSTDTGIDFSVAGTTITFVSPPPAGPFTVSYTFQDPGFELGPRNKNILITGSGFIDCGSDSYRTWPTTALPCYVGCNGICFSKCDSSEVNNITIKKFSPCGIYWGHSEQAKMQNLQLTDQLGFENVSDYVAITCDVLRKSAVFQNFGSGLVDFITLNMCHSMSVTHNKLQRSGSTQNNMIEVFKWGLALGWGLNEDFNADSDISMNELTYNRAPAWEANRFYEGYDSVIVANAAYTNPIAPGPAGFWDWYQQWAPSYNPDNIGDLGSWLDGDSGFSGPSEPIFDNVTGALAEEPPVQVIGDFLGSGGDIDPDGTGSRVFLSFLGNRLADDSDLTVYVNGVPQVNGVDYNLTLGSVTFTRDLLSTEKVTADYMSSSFAWAPGLGPESGPRYLTGILSLSGETPGNGAEATSLHGIRVEHNIITDNDQEAILFTQVNDSSISYNMIARNENGIEEADCGAYDDHPAIRLPCNNLQIVQNTITYYPNYSGGSIRPPVFICPQDTGTITVDNPTVDPTLIERGGMVQSFYNVVSGEVPTPAPNGTTTTFTLAHTPVTGTVEVFLNGILENPSAYGVAGATIVFTTAPSSGSTIDVNYQWQ